jgi:hypothetical protein
MNNPNDMCSMPGMESMCGAHAESSAHAPAWLLAFLALWFAAGALFYLYRTLSPGKLVAVYGGKDLENEIGHGICMASMVTMLVPAFLPIPFQIWAAILGLGSAWFAVRTFTWGLKRPGNKWWWDGIHVCMLGFMALMFAGVSSPLLNIASGAFWVFFTVYASYYTYKLRRIGPSLGWLELGSDLAHITMGIAMFVMIVAPTALMAGTPGMDGMSKMSGMSAMSNPPICKTTR